MDTAIKIPFLIGFSYLIGFLLVRGFIWIKGLSKIDKLRLVKSFNIKSIGDSVKEICFEALLHRRIYKINPVLGYMHMSFALGWLLLILVGHIETVLAQRNFFVPIYMPVFFRYFNTGSDFFFSQVFTNIMDFLLFFILFGLALAIVKRFYKKIFGLTRTTKLKTGDRIAMSTLWLIFPVRLLAESLSAAIKNNGGFLTQNIGEFIANFIPPEKFQVPAYFAYSIVLCLFFVALPNSRYMHIPTELLLIFLRNAGIKLKKRNSTYAKVQVYSCSRCGICLDNCQLTAAGIYDTQSVYILKRIRNKNLTDEELFNCLMCGKCQIDCPVGIDLVNLRTTQRIESTLQYNSSYDYLKHEPSQKADVVYFAGCMTHLTPGIIKAMKQLFAIAGDKVWFIDKEKAPCCGRPLMLAGQYEAASKLIEKNTEMILASGAKQLVVSCPICYKVFKEDYKLGDIDVIFHAQYILNLIQINKLSINKTNTNVIFHDPCELGRGMQMYNEPREILKLTANLISISNEREKSFCCGGSLGNLKISQQERTILQEQSIDYYLNYNPDILITACPLCKKTFVRNKNIKVMDIAEVIVQHSDIDINSKRKNNLFLVQQKWNQ